MSSGTAQLTASKATAGRFSWRPMASAISRNGTPSSPAPCSREPAFRKSAQACLTSPGPPRGTAG